MRRLTVLTALAMALVALGVVGAVRAGDGLVRARVVVDGVPLTVVQPAGAEGEHPGAVVVHGFAGSAALMQPFGDTLARNGYVVVLPDLAGHGASTRRLSDPLSDVDTAVRFLHSQAGVDPDRTVLIGHSRGASAVTAYAGAHREIAATVALSLGQAPATLPSNLLVLYGQFEFPGFALAAEETLLRRDPTATVSTGHTYGSAADGTALRADPVPGVEHVSILFSSAAHERTLAWLDASVRPGAGDAAVHPTDRLWPAGILLLGLLIGLVPVARLLLGTPTRVASGTPTPVASAGATPPERVGLALAAGLTAGGVVGAVLPDPVAGLAVGGYAAVVLLAVGVGVGALSGCVRGWRAGLQPSSVLRGVMLAAYVTAMVALPVHIGLTWAAPNPARIVALLVVGIGVWALFAAAEQLCGGRWYLHAAVLLASVMLLFAMAVTGLGPSFLTLVLALFAGLLAIASGVAAVVRRHAAPPRLTSAVAASAVVWTIAATLPLA